MMSTALRLSLPGLTRCLRFPGSTRHFTASRLLCWIAPVRSRRLCATVPAGSRGLRDYVAHVRRVVYGRNYLLVTNITVCTSLLGAGDVCQQLLRCYRNPHCNVYTPTRTLNLMAAGVPLGAIYHYYYILLERLLPLATLRHVAYKVAINQLLFAPVAWCTYLYVLTCIEHKAVNAESRDAFVKRLYEKGPILYAVDWAIWPAASFINFRYLPLRYRVTFDSCVAFLFDWFMSFMLYDYDRDE